jgi:RNA polymerase sigma-70 factor (ECF subfamily)
VARYIQIKVGDPRTVEDLSGEVFVRVLEGLQRGYSWKDSPKGWIMGIARHVVADYYRQQNRTKEVELTDHLTVGEENTPPHLAMVNERKQILWEAIQQLTNDQRDVILMRFMGGIDIKSVAKAINKTPGAVKALQHRALRALAEKINGLNAETNNTGADE